MPHVANRNAFLAARNCGHPLLCAYGLLVATELALKDQSGQWKKKHDIPQMLTDLGDPGLTGLVSQLRADLSSIPCTNIEGLPDTARPQVYPDLRYARCANDHPGGATDADFRKLVEVVNDIIIQLGKKGVPV